MDIIDRINALLCERGKTGADLCRDLGLSSGVYSQWNTGKTKPSNRTIKKIAEYLEVSVSYLLTGCIDGKKDPAPTDGNEVITDKETFLNYVKNLEDEDELWTITETTTQRLKELRDNANR